MPFFAHKCTRRIESTIAEDCTPQLHRKPKQWIDFLKGITATCQTSIFNIKSITKSTGDGNSSLGIWRDFLNTRNGSIFSFESLSNLLLFLEIATLCGIFTSKELEHH